MNHLNAKQGKYSAIKHGFRLILKVRQNRPAVTVPRSRSHFFSEAYISKTIKVMSSPFSEPWEKCLNLLCIKYLICI